MAYRLGIDIGGTFTDATLIDERTGETRICKVPSTPSDPSVGFMTAARRILREGDIELDNVSYLVHGTTIATNTIIEGKTARTGFVTTEGFRDMLEIGRQIRPSLYDLQFEKPAPLVPRYLCFGVPERLDARGHVLTPLDEDAARRVAKELRRENVEAIAVCFLHSYTNPVHEQRIAKIIQEACPDTPISVSAEVAPEFREYFRASTTIINAGIRPIVERYLRRIEARLRDEGLTAELLVMQSSGGVFSFEAASERPVFMVESGPAAGVISAAHLGTMLGNQNVISFDMGGTTAKAGLVQGSRPHVTKEYEVGATAQAGTGSSRGSGYPIRTPVIDLVEIGAGGGSIAWVDSGGALRVGPQSAGADPGPVCYSNGGTEPTITDANLVLGRLNPDYFLGGEIELDVDGAHNAIKAKCAEPLGLSVVEAAHGIVEIANAAMVNALRLITVQRGLDPRDFVLLAFGGAGPAHANRLAAENEIPTIVIPMSPGTFSATGLLVTDLEHDYTTTTLERIDQINATKLESMFQDLEQQGSIVLEREGVPPDAMAFTRRVDVRYVGQSYELTVSLPDGRLTTETVTYISEEFHREHNRVYGFSAPDEPIEFVNVRVTAIGKIAKPQLHKLQHDRHDFDVIKAQKTVRSVYFAEVEDYIECPIYDRYQLAAGHVVEGPAIIEELDATTVVHPHYRANVDPYGNLILTQGV